MPVRRRHAHRESGRHFAARLAHSERSGRDRLRRHAPDPEAAFAFRYSKAAGELPRAQRNHARAGNRHRAGARRANCAGHRRRHAGNFRSRARLVSLCLRHGIQVVPVPGACAFVAALAASGMSIEEFTFVGFLPSRPTERRKRLRALAEEPRTLGSVRSAAPPARHSGRCARNSGQSPGGGRARIDQSVRGISCADIWRICWKLRARNRRAGKSRC